MDMGNCRRKENGFDPIHDMNESGMQEHDVKMVARQEGSEAEESLFEETVIMDMKDLAREEDRIEGMKGGDKDERNYSLCGSGSHTKKQGMDSAVTTNFP